MNNMHAFMKREGSEGIQTPVKYFGKTTAKAAGVPSRTFASSIKKKLELKEGSNTSVSTPGYHRSTPSKKSADGNFDDEVIRRSIYNFALKEGWKAHREKQNGTPSQSTLCFPAACRVCRVI
jgi:hypothetical protein